MSTDSVARIWSPAGRLLIVLAAAVVVIAGLSGGREIVGPVILAIVLVIVAHPVRYRLEAKGWPRWLATTVVIVIAYLILAILALLLIVAIGQFIRLLPSYSDEFTALVASVQTWLESLGFTSDDASSAVATINPATVLGLILSALKSLVSGATAFFFVLTYILFMAADAAYLHGVFQRFDPKHHALLTSLSSYGTGVRRYLVVNAIFGGIVAVLDGLALMWLGVPGAFIWAVLAFITNFIPNIGFVIGVIPPLVIALLTGGWGLALAVLVVYCVINVTLQVLVQPRFISSAVDISFTLTFFSVIFWGAILGALGALLAVPMTLLVKALLVDRDPDAGLAKAVLGNGAEQEAKAAPPPAVEPESEPSI